MKPLVIFHKDCADGFGAAFAAWMKLGDEAEYLPMSYGQPLAEYFSDLFLPERDIYILDFSFSRAVMEQLFKLARKVIWLDHHKTAFEMWCSSYVKGMAYNNTNDRRLDPSIAHQICLDDNKSGAMLAWEYFHPEKEVPQLIRHIDDYDRWQFKLERTKEFNKALWSYAPWSFEQWEETIENWKGFEFAIEGAAILRAHDQNVQAVVKGSGRECVIPVFEEGSYIPAGGLAANCPPHLASDVGHRLANQSGTYGLLWFIDKDNKCKCSLRSNGDYDVSAIAKVFGGGGHKNAAGFEVNIETLLGWIKWTT